MLSAKKTVQLEHKPEQQILGHPQTVFLIASELWIWNRTLLNPLVSGIIFSWTVFQKQKIDLLFETKSRIFRATKGLRTSSAFLSQAILLPIIPPKINKYLKIWADIFKTEQF